MTDNISYEDIRKQEEIIKQKLLNKYKSLNTYEEKLIFLYTIIFKSQEYYFNYTHNELGQNFALEKLITKLKETTIKNESDFIDFINNNLIIPSNSPHIHLSPSKVEGLVNKSDKQKNIKYEISNNTLILSIKSFSRKYLNEAEKDFNEIKNILENNDIENIIIDIRGNKGGTDEFFKYLSIFSDKDVVFKEHFKDLFTNTEYSFNNIVIQKGTNKNYNGFLLIDEDVFSTSDTLTRICKSEHFATLIGSKTRGEGYGCSIITLPILEKDYTGILTKDGNYKVNGINLSFPIHAPLNELGIIDYDSLYRTVPDIEVSSDEALKVALDLIEIEKNKSI